MSRSGGDTPGTSEVRFDLHGIDQLRLCGPGDAHLRYLENRFDGTISARGEQLRISGPPDQVARMRDLVSDLMERVRRGQRIDEVTLDYLWASHARGGARDTDLEAEPEPLLFTSESRRPVRVKSPGQRRYVQAVRDHDVVFAIGPAGTGKTYLAVVLALDYLKRNLVERVLLVRPAVEAGEQLGYLPGDLQEKINPYLRPLYDALADILGPTRVARYVEGGVVEASPLAYMRGRTLSNAFVILDEAQNTTIGQMKMFLTRLGYQSKAVITGDVTQIDLADPDRSGLVRAQEILRETEGVAIVRLGSADTQRHPLVRRIVDAFADAEQAANGRSAHAHTANEPAAELQPGDERT